MRASLASWNEGAAKAEVLDLYEQGDLRWTRLRCSRRPDCDVR